MRIRWIAMLLLVLGVGAAGCTGYVVGRPHGYYGGYYGRGPWYGWGGRDVVIVDPCRGGACGPDRPDFGGPEAVPLPEPPPGGMPEAMPTPDVGMPDVDFGGMDMDVGGFDF
jgi:hypothetical protein